MAAEEISTLNNWITQRQDWLDKNMPDIRVQTSPIRLLEHWNFPHIPILLEAIA